MNNYELFLLIEKHLMEDAKPSLFLNKFLEEHNLKDSCFYILEALKFMPNKSLKREKTSVWKQTLLVVDEAAKYREYANNSKAFMWSALLHSIGKTKTTIIEENNVFDDNYEVVGCEMSRRLLRDCSLASDFINIVANLIKNQNTYLYVLKRLSNGNVHSMIKNSDIHDVALLSLCSNLSNTSSNIYIKQSFLTTINKFITIMEERTGLVYNKLEIQF